MPSEALVVSVWDEDASGSELIGLCSLAPLSKDKWFDLYTDGADSKPAGQVQLNIVCQKVNVMMCCHYYIFSDFSQIPHFFQYMLRFVLDVVFRVLQAPSASVLPKRVPPVSVDMSAKPFELATQVSTVTVDGTRLIYYNN